MNRTTTSLILPTTRLSSMDAIIPLQSITSSHRSLWAHLTKAILQCFLDSETHSIFHGYLGVSRWIRKDWQEIEEDVMYKALFHKFTQYKHLMELLLSTGDRRLVEDSPHDSYWGIGSDHRGQNRLGELLMRLRNDLRISTDGGSTTHNPSTQLSPSNTADSCFHSNIAGHDETGEKPDKDGSNVIKIDDDDDGNDHPNPNHTDMKPSGDTHVPDQPGTDAGGNNVPVVTPVVPGVTPVQNTDVKPTGVNDPPEVTHNPTGTNTANESLVDPLDAHVQGSQDGSHDLQTLPEPLNGSITEDSCQTMDTEQPSSNNNTETEKMETIESASDDDSQKLVLVNSQRSN